MLDSLGKNVNTRVITHETLRHDFNFTQRKAQEAQTFLVNIKKIKNTFAWHVYHL